MKGSSKDLNGYLFHRLRKIRINLSRFYGTWIGGAIYWLKGISIGKHTAIHGMPLITRYPYSRIVIGKNCRLRSDLTTNLERSKRCILMTRSKNAYIEIGDYCGLNGASISAKTKVKLGNYVLCGIGSIFTDYDNHCIDPVARMNNSGIPKTAPIEVGDNVWIGANALILKGVTIGKNSVIGAYSVVTKSIPENVIAAGNPCKVIREI
jgi:acetyltransferase-like isoleucine patch superfamily enzyme